MSSIRQRAAQFAGMFSSPKSPDELPWDAENTKLPLRKDLPKVPGAPEGAAWVWGKNDNVRGVHFVDGTFMSSYLPDAISED